MKDTDFTTPLTPDRMASLLGMADEDAEPILFKRLQQITATFELGYAEVGLICREVDSYLLWEKRIDPETGQPCTSFTRWVRVCCPRSYPTAYAAMRDVESLKDIPDQHLSQIPASNFPIVKQLSTAVRSDPEVLEAAKTQNTEGLVEHVRANHPEQHIERTKILRVPLDESAMGKVEELFKQAQLRGAKNRSEALEMICAEAELQWRLEAEIEEAATNLEDRSIPMRQGENEMDTITLTRLQWNELNRKITDAGQTP